MPKKPDILVLNRGHELNYRALCNFIHGRKVRSTQDRRINDMVPWARKFVQLTKQDFRCAHCGKEFERSGKRWLDVSTDHVIEFQYGGEATNDNIQMVHYACNLERAENYSLAIIEQHYGPVDLSMIEDLPVVRFPLRRNKPNV